MPAKIRALVIALALGAFAGAIGVTMETLPMSTLPGLNRIADLVAHFSAIDYSKELGLSEPSYDTEKNPNLAIVAIDGATYQKMGFPFPRGVYKTFLEKLKAAGAKTVVFDIDFINPHPDQDKIFAAGMREIPTVLGFTINTTTTGRIGEELPVPILQSAAAAIGHNTVDTPGGYLIGQPLEVDTSGLGEHANERILSLAGAAVSTYTGRRIDTAGLPQFNEGGGPIMLLMPAKADHYQLNGVDVFKPPPFAKSMISFADVIDGKPQGLRPFANGALVYVGATASGLFDFSTTAGRGRIPGLFVNARLADQLMRGIYLRQAPLFDDVLLTIALPLLAALTFSLMRTSLAIVLSFATTILYAYLNVYLFVEKLYWFDLIHVVGAMIVGTMFVAIYRVINEGSQRRMVTNLFGKHVSLAVVDDILRQDDPKGALALRGKRVKATIFYSDIRGFTSMSETMTPEEIYTQLNEYFEEMCNIIFRHGGYVDKFIGDCVMAVFSAPYQTPDDAKNAVVAAVEQQQKILELSARWKAEGKKEFTVGMGINTGDVVMGNLGASSRMNYTVIGDNVNVAARLYNVAKGGEIIISETTYAECAEIAEVEEREPVAVKGKSRPIAIYNVTRLKVAASSPTPTIPPELAPA